MTTSPNDLKLNGAMEEDRQGQLVDDRSSHAQSLAAATADAAPTNPSLVPKGFTIGLALFSLLLSVSGYGFRLAIGEEVSAVLKHAAVLVPAFVIGIPVLFWLGSLVMNKVTGSHIQRRNAMTLGWLCSCVGMLWLMGTYS